MAQDNPLSKPVANPLLLPYSGQGQGQNLPAPSLSPDSGLGKFIMEETQRPAQEGMSFHQSNPVLFTLMSLLPGFGQGYSRAQADKSRQQALQFSQRHQQAQDLLNYGKLREQGFLSGENQNAKMQSLVTTLGSKDPVAAKKLSDTLNEQGYMTVPPGQRTGLPNLMPVPDPLNPGKNIPNEYYDPTTGKFLNIKPPGGMFGNVDLSPHQIDNLAASMAQGNPVHLPFSPQVNVTIQSKAIDRIMKEKGVGRDEAARILAERQAGYHGRTSAAGRLGGQAALLQSFEQSAEGIMNQVTEPAYQALSDQMTSSPVYNRIMLEYKANVSGDPAAQNWLSNMTTLRGEIAKIVSGSLGVAASSDAARKEAERILPDGVSPKQFSALLPMIKQELSARIGGAKGTLREITGGSYPRKRGSKEKKGILSAKTPTVPPGAVTGTYNGKKGYLLGDKFYPLGDQ